MRKKVLIALLAVFALTLANCSSEPKKETPAETAVDGKCTSGDCKNGRGTVTYNDGSKYEGDFKDGKMNGEGTLTFVNGDSYKGNFANDMFSGKGTYKYANGDIYEGDFKNDLFDGNGVLTTKKGNKYTGGFREGKFDGDGTVTQPDGDTLSGTFKMDIPLKGVVKSKDGRVNVQKDFTQSMPAELKKRL